MNRFTWEELADIHYTYGLAAGNNRLAQRLYAQNHPNRQQPDHRLFINVHNNLRQAGNLRVSKKHGSYLLLNLSRRGRSVLSFKSLLPPKSRLVYEQAVISSLPDRPDMVFHTSSRPSHALRCQADAFMLLQLKALPLYDETKLLPIDRYCMLRVARGSYRLVPS